MVLDIGQNIAGYIELTIEADEGVEIKFEHSEVLDENGNYMQNGYGLVTAPAECAVETNDALRLEIEKTTAFIDGHGMLNSLYPTKVGDYLWWGNKYAHKDNFIVDKSCNAPFVNASIAYNGDVFLCCNGGALTGKVRDKSFKEVWQSVTYNELREAVNSNMNMPKTCRTCAWFNK